LSTRARRATIRSNPDAGLVVIEIPEQLRALKRFFGRRAQIADKLTTEPSRSDPRRRGDVLLRRGRAALG
jgi:hypothetical protein